MYIPRTHSYSINSTAREYVAIILTKEYFSPPELTIYIHFEVNAAEYSREFSGLTRFSDFHFTKKD